MPDTLNRFANRKRCFAQIDIALVTINSMVNADNRWHFFRQFDATHCV